jgi:hypothetical protein
VIFQGARRDLDQSGRGAGTGRQPASPKKKYHTSGAIILTVLRSPEACSKGGPTFKDNQIFSGALKRNGYNCKQTCPTNERSKPAETEDSAGQIFPERHRALKR